MEVVTDEEAVVTEAEEEAALEALLEVEEAVMEEAGEVAVQSGSLPVPTHSLSTGVLNLRSHHQCTFRTCVYSTAMDMTFGLHRPNSQIRIAARALPSLQIVVRKLVSIWP